ncbi:F-box domain-containing protein [Heracleum sosnowskyi]|uniref:F-box domain-containing protein n=1 Tax=Heracleum sosnowskyi TaxID=360622 RepID=A0AAD8JIR9_9APIA|nr:F-box domain-containing protein [Heracleum sosnowskyi]
MGSRVKKKRRVLETEKDRISRLPDDLIHKILSFVDAKEAVQTSVFSKRWKLVWTTLPFLNIGEYVNCSPWHSQSNFIYRVLEYRHRNSNILELSLCVSKDGLTKGLLKQFLAYAISRNLETLSLVLNCKHMSYKLSTLSSRLLKKLTLGVKLEDFESESNCWDLPALTYLCLKRPGLDGTHKLPESCLTCLPALRTLCLDDWDLSKSSFSFSLPNLTSLRLSGCSRLSAQVWNFPALLSLVLEDVYLRCGVMFSKLVNLQNLTLSMVKFPLFQLFSLSLPQLLNLNIRTSCSDSNSCINLSTPKLLNFTSVGVFSISLEAPELENVSVKLQGWFVNIEWIYRKHYYRRFWNMLSQLANAKNLTFDLESIEALSAISDDLASKPSPFHNLKYVKLPQDYNESSISTALRSYLLGGSSRGTIVTSPPRNTIPCTEEHVVEDSVVDADRVRDIDAPLEEIGKDPVSTSRGNRYFGLWLGHKVNYEFLGLLDRIMHQYPETFENFTKKKKKLCTMNLNMFCTSVNDFTKISMSEVDSEMLVEYRDAFAYLQNEGFNVSWVVRRLDYIEHLRFSNPLIPELYALDCRINDDKSKLQELQACVDDAKLKLQNLQARVDDAKSKLQDVQTHRAEKLKAIKKAFGKMGTKLAIGFIGDDLLSSP